jgi:hypothetical protein
MRDQTIRQLLRRTELSKYINDPHSKVVEELELPVAGARVDIAVINGCMHGFEIKSAVDTLKRLPSQLDAYSKVFDFLSIITEAKHYKKVLSFLPSWVGLYVCEEINGQESIKEIQAPQRNTAKNGFFLAKLLWRDEIMSILGELSIPHKKKDRNWIQCETLANNVNIEVLSELVRQKLKSRPTEWKTKEGYEAK